MEKLNDFIYRIMSSIQVILNVFVNLVFQPFYSLATIIEGLAAIWCNEIEYEEEQKPEQQPQQNVTTYSSANDGRMGPEEEWDCDYPLGRIGFKINQSEQKEINKIKKELNQ